METISEEEQAMDKRTIRRWDGQNGTMYEIEAHEHSWNCKSADAIRVLREDFGLEEADAEAVVYNARQSSRPCEF